ncbi:MAG TPA: hypothetical protein VK177_11515 [Flavobacteriales bacterium]|nr:hypothetical protein [Flavobacteriales bacterium]
MKKIVYISIFLLAILLFACKNILHYSPSFVNIANDILALPFFLVTLDLIMKFLYGNRFQLNLPYVLVTLVTVCILFEGILPIKYTNMTADPLDILWYFTGSILFLGFQWKYKSKTIHS